MDLFEWQGVWSSYTQFGEFRTYPITLFPDMKEIQVATCREYATCDYFWKNQSAIRDSFESSGGSASCENVNGSEENCDRLRFICPPKLKSKVEYVTCEQVRVTSQNINYNIYKKSGEWKFPESSQTYEDILCQEDNDFIDENPTEESKTESSSKPTSEPTSEPEIKLCKDLNNRFFDETVDVSSQFCFPLVKTFLENHLNDCINFKVECSTNNSVCRYICKVGSGMEMSA